MATFGNQNAINGIAGSSGYQNTGFAPLQFGSRFLCPSSGTLTSITAYVGTSTVGTDVRVGIFSDNAGAPNTLIAEGIGFVSNYGSWVTCPVPAQLIGGTYYWLVLLGVRNDVAILQYYDPGTANQWCRCYANDGTFVSPWGTNLLLYQPWSLSIYATYDEGGVSQWSLNISAGAGGTTNPAAGTVLRGNQGSSTPTLMALPSSGYQFDYWLLDNATQYTQNPLSLQINDALTHTIQAVFKAIQYQYILTVQSEPSSIPFTLS